MGGNGYSFHCMVNSKSSVTLYPQLELGTKITEWVPSVKTENLNKPYIEDFSMVKVTVNNVEYTPNADGTITDIISISPSMEITTDNEYVNICDFTYNADTKSYIDTAQVGKKTVEGGEIFNDYENNKALYINSHSEGNGNIASCLGFKILSTRASTILLDNGTEKENCLVLRLEGVADNLAQFTEGNQISFQWNNNFDLCCNVLKLVECTDTYTDIAIDNTPHNFDASKTTSGWLWVPSSPEIGNTQLGIGAHAEGYSTRAVQLASHTEGYNTIAAGRYAHAEGNSTIAVYAAHAEGNSTKALGQESHAEGHGTNATGIGAHSEGGATVAEGKYSHAEGENTQATGYRAHTEGFKTKASGKGAHAEGFTTEAQGENSHAEGWETKALGMASHAEGISTTAEVLYSHAEGNGTNAKGQSSHTEGVSTTATSIASHAEGSSTTAGAASAHAEGDGSKALGIGSHAEGLGTEAQGNYSHSEGRSSKAIGVNSHSEGNSTESNGVSSHAEGNYAKSKGKASHAEGNYATASGESSHAEGSYTNASGTYSHAEGNNTQATGAASHAEGYRSKAKADYAHAAGEYSEATVQSQYVVGKYNKINNDAMFIVGNGETTDTRSNAFEVYKDGHAEIQTMGTTDNSVATKAYVGSAAASAITNTIAGGEKSLTINDVSPLEHKCSCKLTSDTYEAYVTNSKNIFDVSTLYVGMYQDTPAPNLIIDNEANGSFTVSGKIPPYDSLYCSGKIENLTKGITYTFSIRNSKGQAHGVRLIKFTANDDYIGEVDVSTPYTFTFGEENVEIYRFIDWLPRSDDGETEYELEETTYYIQLEEGSQMTDWVPAGGTGKNVYKFNNTNITLPVNNEEHLIVDYTINENGTISYTGRSIGGFNIDFKLDNLIVDETYTFSVTNDGFPQNGSCWVNGFRAYDKNGNQIGDTIWVISDHYTFTHTNDVTYYMVDYVLPIGVNDENPIWSDVDGTIYPQLELGTEATEWEEYTGVKTIEKPYIEDFSTIKVKVGSKSYTPLADGTVTGIESVSPTMNITTDNEHVNIVDFAYNMDTKAYIDSKFEELKQLLLNQ